MLFFHPSNGVIRLINSGDEAGIVSNLHFPNGCGCGIQDRKEMPSDKALIVLRP